MSIASMGITNRYRVRKKATFLLACFMAVLLSFSTTPTEAWAASTGVDYSSGAIDITYGSGDVVQGTWHESVLTVDDEWVYCANVNAEYAVGLEVSCEDPVATGTWSQAMVTDLALASDFIWAGKFRSSAQNGDGHMITSNLEKYAVTQVLVWEIMNSYGYSDFGWFGAGVGDLGLTGSDDGHADCWDYINANRDTTIGHANYYDGGSAQSVVCGFWIEPIAPPLGAIDLEKHSANKSISKNNDCYSLKGAVYGVFETKTAAKTHDADKALHTYKTDDDGTWSSDSIYEAGTYYVAEIKPPRGFALDKSVYAVDVQAGSTTRVNEDIGYTLDEPQSNPINLWAKKADAETADGSAQGSASLEGAQFEIAYYDGYYDKISSLPKKATRTWIVASDRDGKAYANENLKVSGDDFYYTKSGEITIPLGTVTVREVKPPSKYLLGNGADEAGGMQLVQIKSDDTGKTLQVYTAPTFSDHIMRGGVAVGKIDRHTGLYLPQGAATLAGAEFEITSSNAQPVIVDETSYSTGEVVKVIETELVDGAYIARTADNCLPAGYYSIRESATSEGYAYDEASQAWSRDFEITEDGQMVDLTNPSDAVSNQVVRGDFSFTKIDGQTGARLAFIPFIMTSVTTGEQHVIMTDENGMFSTAATWNAHTKKTNMNDGAITKSASGYTLDETVLDASAGTWFSGSADIACDPDDGVGALPYDTYDVMELRASTNEGYNLASFTVTISRHNVELELGTVDDNAGPLIGTTLSDENGEHLITATPLATVIDEVHYANLDMRTQYTLDGSLHLVNEDGSDGGVVANAQVTFSPLATNGAVEVEFTVDTSALGGCRLVAFERLLDAQGNVVAIHEDLADEGQTVRVPGIGTVLTDSLDGSHETSSHEEVTLVDTVAFQGLVPGKAYVMTGTLHIRDDSGADAGVALDAKGNPITASQTFTPDTSEGTVEVSFTFCAPNLAGSSLVAFEELTRKDLTYAVHADIADDEQTVHMPAIGTTLIDATDGNHEATADETITLIDRIAYNGLTVGQAYTVTGTLHIRDDSGADAGVALDAKGNPITASQTFTPETSAGEIEMAFMFEAPDLAGQTVVAFEELLFNERIYASHADIADEGQTVRFAPPREEEGEPPEKETPPKETTPPEKVTPPKETTPPTTETPVGKTALPKTGDGIDIMVLIVIAGAAMGMAAGALCIRAMRRDREIPINRGPLHR